MKKMRYNFNNWKSGKIHDDFYSNNMPSQIYKNVRDIGHLPWHMYPEGLLSYKTLVSITDAQKEVFYKLSKHNAKGYLSSFKIRHSKAMYPNKFLLQKLNSLEKRIEEYPSKIIESYYAGEWSRTGIDYTKYQIINSDYLHQGEVISIFDLSPNKQIRDKDNHLIELYKPKEFKNTPNYLFDLTIDFLLIEGLKKIKESMYLNETDKSEITRQEILNRAHKLKENGMKVEDMFEEISHWLKAEIGFTDKEIKTKFNFSLKNPESFNRTVNNNPNYS